MERIRRIQVIYGDGTSESYLSKETYNQAWERARETARKRGTLVRSFACINL